MIKIAFIGAGSIGFTRELVRDILTFPLLENVQLALMDIDAERLDFAKRSVEKIIAFGKYPATVTARYHILPYAGEFDEARAHKFAAESEHSRPVVQHLGEPAASQLLPASGSLLHLPQPPILTLTLRTESDCTILTLLTLAMNPMPRSFRVDSCPLSTPQPAGYLATRKMTSR